MRLLSNIRIYAGLIIAMLFLSNSMASTARAQQNVRWYSFEDALAIADSTQRPIFVDVWAPWCGWCRKMKRDVYPKLTAQLSKQFVLTRLNRDDNHTIHHYMSQKISSLRLAKLFKTQSVPAIVLLNSKGSYLLDLSGFMRADKLKPVLNYISSNAYQDRSFAEFKKMNSL